MACVLVKIIGDEFDNPDYLVKEIPKNLLELPMQYLCFMM